MWVAYTRPKSNTKVFGRLIALLTKKKHQKASEVPSHMQMVFGRRFSLESRFDQGVKIGFFPNTIEQADVLAVFNYTSGYEQGLKDGILLYEGAKRYHGLKYDYLGIIVFLFYVLRRKLFGTAVPPINKRDNKRRMFCSELFEFIDGGDSSLIDPNSQMLSLYYDRDFELIYDHTRDGDFKKWFQPELDKLNSMIRK